MNKNFEQELIGVREIPILIDIALFGIVIFNIVGINWSLFDRMEIAHGGFNLAYLIGALFFTWLFILPYILIHNKKISGVYLYVIYLFLIHIIFGMFIGSFLISIFIGIIRAGIMSLLLFVPIKGVTVYQILKYQKKHNKKRGKKQKEQL